jgi:Flp pilus assembly protein TadD
MSMRARILLGLSLLLIISGVHAQQTGTSKRPARPTPAIASSPPSEAAIKEMVKAGRSAEAARLLEESARRTPGNKSIKARVAEVYESQGDLAAAKQAAREAMAGDAQSPEALGVLGRIAAREADWAKAVVYSRSLISVTPNNALAHLDYANALEHVGDAAAADNEYAIFRSLSGMPPLPNDFPKK